MSRATTPVWHLDLTVPASQVEAFEALLGRWVEALSVFEREDLPHGPDGPQWRLEGYSEDPVDPAEVLAAVEVTAAAMGVPAPETVVAPVADRDWLTENLESFEPIRAGRYWVRGSHLTDRRPHGTHDLMVDAGAAFGSGEHATTHGCLLALDALARHMPRPHRVLDLGCGTAVLAMAAVRTWAVPVIATDIDPRSVAIARDNARRNGLAEWVRTDTAPGFRSRLVTRNAPYDLIFANILARPLMRLAPEVKAHLALGGRLVLSGLLRNQETMVLNAYLAQGLRLERRIRLDPWSALVLRLGSHALREEHL